MSEAANQFFANLHLLRPWWLVGVVPALLIAFHLHKRSIQQGNWKKVINPALLPYLLQGDQQQSRQTHWVWLPLWIACCIALSGPSWQKLPQPVHQQENALIILFDLSPSMLAEDVAPNRLTRAGFKLRDLLALRTEGQTGLVVYSDDAYIVSPLTDDANTIAAMVPSLHPNIMPGRGSNIELAVEKALEMAFQAGFANGDLIAITDGIASTAESAVVGLVDGAGDFTLSILGVGTDDGAPIPVEGGNFARQSDGSIVLPKLNSGFLQSIATKSRGRYQTITANNQDIQTLLDARNWLSEPETRQTEREFDVWDDKGWLLLLFVVPLCLYLFRRGVVISILLLPLLITPDRAVAFEWQDLWQTPDQRGQHALDNGNAQRAKQLFDSPMHRGQAAFELQDYQTAAESFGELDSAQAHYNRGNALAKAGELEQAIAAYDEALRKNPKLEQAQKNKELVKELLDKQQDQQQNDQDQNNQDQQDQEQQNQQNQDQQDSNQQNNDQQQSDSQKQDEQQGEGQEEQQQQNSSGDQQQSGDEQPPEPREQQQQGETEQQDSQQQSSEQQQAQQAEQQSPQTAETSEELDELTEEQKQNLHEIEQVLRKVPDDPGGLLRNKLYYESQLRKAQRRNSRPQTEEDERW